MGIITGVMPQTDLSWASYSSLPPAIIPATSLDLLLKAFHHCIGNVMLTRIAYILSLLALTCLFPHCPHSGGCAQLTAGLYTPICICNITGDGVQC